MSQMRHRWALCEAIAAHLGVTKNQVHTYLFDKLSKNIAEDAARGDAESLRFIQERPEYKELLRTRERPETAGEQIRIALWFLAKFESPEQAKEALEVAIQAQQRLEKPRTKVEESEPNKTDCKPVTGD